MDLTSCGAHLVILITGRGNVVGNAVAPCIKLTGNSETYKRMEEDMDFDAGPVLEGNISLNEMADVLAEYIAETAGGRPTKVKHWDTENFIFPINIRIPRRHLKRNAGYRRRT